MLHRAVLIVIPLMSAAESDTPLLAQLETMANSRRVLQSNGGNKGNGNGNSGSSGGNQAKANGANKGNGDGNSGDTGGSSSEKGGKPEGAGKPKNKDVGLNQKAGAIKGRSGNGRAMKIEGNATASIKGSKAKGTAKAAARAAAKGRNMTNDCSRLQMQIDKAATTRDNRGQIAKRLRLQAEFLLNCVGPPTYELDCGSADSDGDCGSGVSDESDYTVLVVADVTGDVDSICSGANVDSYISKLAAKAGVPDSGLQLSCQAGSALLSFYIAYSDQASFDAGVSSLDTSMSTASDSSTVLGATVDDSAIVYASPDGSSYLSVIDDGLSTGALVGIIVGSIAGAAIILLVVVWCVRRKNKKAAGKGINAV